MYIINHKNKRTPKKFKNSQFTFTSGSENSIRDIKLPPIKNNKPNYQELNDIDMIDKFNNLYRIFEQQKDDNSKNELNKSQSESSIYFLN